MFLKKKNGSSKKWLNEHFQDKYVKQAKKNKLRSRAWFKLEQIDNKYKLLHVGMNIIDLGSSPGSWLEYSVNKIGDTGTIIACDILPMKNINNVNFIQGDLRDNMVLNKLFFFCKNKKFNLVMSDMSPNISGYTLIDLPRIFFLNELALFIANKVLIHNGIFLVKSFLGKGFDSFLKKLHTVFLQVKTYKPDSSRSRSREIFILAIGLKY
ncbi:Ribosomal RNA large subunit methyltransferase E [Buchnera aphidicola (Eriosoma lanigerum)]|uniref:23S rRNA (uridine(2552)-2'-O)-methyltransferase RlmE n=1 Tax=Buchnera aphidicola TaxID=9 RepID=UPI003463FE74